MPDAQAGISRVHNPTISALVVPPLCHAVAAWWSAGRAPWGACASPDPSTPLLGRPGRSTPGALGCPVPGILCLV